MGQNIDKPCQGLQQRNNFDKQFKRVSFSSSVVSVVGTVLSSSSMAESERDDVWYRPAELESFKDEARDLSRMIYEAGEASLGSSSDSSMQQVGRPMAQHELCVMDGACDEQHTGENKTSVCVRGLEQRVSFERQRNKYLARRAVLEAQKRIQAGTLAPPSPNAKAVDRSVHLALIASKCTAWARDVALQTGRNDFFEAYPSAAALCPPPARVMTMASFPPLKRKVSDEQDAVKSRKVRRRIAFSSTAAKDSITPIQTEGQQQ